LVIVNEGSACQRLSEIYDRLNEIEEQIANVVPTAFQSVWFSFLLKYPRTCVPDGLDEKLVDNMLAGLEALPAGG
jgi:hypothetical protein